MLTLISKNSSFINFPDGSHVVGRIPRKFTIIVETGVAVFNLVGTNPHDWTRDTLAFPVGWPIPTGSFVYGMALGHPASFWTPGSNTGPIGYAVDSAAVTFTPGSSQAELTLQLAVFGNNAAMQRCGYTAYILISESELFPNPVGSTSS